MVKHAVAFRYFLICFLYFKNNNVKEKLHDGNVHIAIQCYFSTSFTINGSSIKRCNRYFEPVILHGRRRKCCQTNISFTTEIEIPGWRPFTWKGNKLLSALLVSFRPFHPELQKTSPDVYKERTWILYFSFVTLIQLEWNNWTLQKFSV